MTEQGKPGWMKQQIDDARAEIAAWPKWRRELCEPEEFAALLMDPPRGLLRPLDAVLYSESPARMTAARTHQTETVKDGARIETWSVLVYPAAHVEIREARVEPLVLGQVRLGGVVVMCPPVDDRMPCGCREADGCEDAL